MRKIKIVYSGLKYDYFDKSRGFSFEHVNFYGTLKRIREIDLIYFPYERLLEIGRDKMNQELLNLIKKEKPDIFFAVMFTDELKIDILDEIKKYTNSVAWFCDDHWRFDNYSKHYAPHFSWVVTTYSKAVKEYKKIRAQNVIHSQWAANTQIYKPTKWGGDKEPPEVSFVGTWSAPRARIIKELIRSGISVSVYGHGWENGKITQEKMVEIFSNSKINLALNPAPGFFNKNSLGRLFFRRSINKIVPDFHLINNLKAFCRRGIHQIKARHFEIPACGGFVISGLTDDIENYYKNGEEMVFYKNTDDLIDKIKYYLSNSESEKIKKAGYQRTIREYTYPIRFSDIFNTVLNR